MFDHTPANHSRSTRPPDRPRRRLVAIAAVCAGVAFAAPVATVAAERTVESAQPSAVVSASVEVLRLDCAVAPGHPLPDATRVRVGCRWSLPTSARVLTLWRSVDGGPRERVASFTHRFPSSYRDVVPASAQRVVYAVIGTDGSGDIVARSRPDGVVIAD